MGYAISVLISTYNNRRFVEKKLAEVRRQSIFAQAEFIFVETASPEHEREWLAPFCQTHPNCRLLASDTRQTLYEAWNLGWDAASAPLLCYSNMDDAMHPRLLEAVVAAMHQRPWDVCSVLIAKQYDNDPALDDWSIGRLRRLEWSLRPGPFSAWRADLKERIGQFDGRFVVSGDKDFWARITAHRFRVGLVKRVLYLYTKSTRQLSKARDTTWRQTEVHLHQEKLYPLRWHPGLRWQIFWRRWVFRILPHLYTLPVQ
jgi:GT2 family glycosyltransferase